MQYCKNCVMPTTRPGLHFDEYGVCSACRWVEEKENIDFSSRAEQFQEVANWARSHARGPWHCVVGVSGGKDSIWQAHMIRDHFGLNPLLVQYVASDGTELGRKNAESLVCNGFTLHSMQPNPQVARKLAKKSFIEFGNLDKYSEFSLYTAPFRAAIDFDIPLVLLGENPALEAGDKNMDTPGWDASGIRFNNTLGGALVDMWLGDGIERRDLIPYTFPSQQELDAWGGRGVFMGYFLNWSGWDNAVFAMRHGMQPINAKYDDIGIHYLHNSLDSNNGAMVNSMLKHIKLGFGNTTEFSTYDVRNGRMTRAEAAALVKRLDGKCHVSYIKEFCNWIGISVDEFWRVANGYRGTMWNQDKSGEWFIDNGIWEQEDINGIDTDLIISRLDTIPYSGSSVGNRYCLQNKNDLKSS